MSIFHNKSTAVIYVVCLYLYSTQRLGNITSQIELEVQRTIPVTQSWSGQFLKLHVLTVKLCKMASIITTIKLYAIWIWVNIDPKNLLYFLLWDHLYQISHCLRQKNISIVPTTNYPLFKFINGHKHQIMLLHPIMFFIILVEKLCIVLYQPDEMVCDYYNKSKFQLSRLQGEPHN